MYRHRFLENKNHIIDRLVNLTDAQKDEIKSFFQKHPSYESKIDWNDKSLSYKDFEPVLRLDGKSKTQARKKGIEGITEGTDYEYLGSGVNDDWGTYRLYRPLTYLGSKTLASNKVPPVKENGAKWCIAYQKTDKYWNDYTEKDIRFLFVLTKDTKYAITIYPEDLGRRIEIYDFDDEQYGEYALPANDHFFWKAVHKLQGFTTGRQYLDELVQKGVLSLEDGVYMKWSSETMADPSRLIDDGCFICRFGFWNGHFTCNRLDLTTLEGCPETVMGRFDCGSNMITSLKGGPKTVKGDFYCDNTLIETLEGGPTTVEGFYNCSDCRLKTLKGAPKRVGDGFDCRGNKDLISLEYGPKEVAGTYFCGDCSLTSLTGLPKGVLSLYAYDNRLTSLEGLPRRMYTLFISGNRLKSLEGCPKSIVSDFDCSSNPLYSLEGGPKEVGGNYYCKDIGLTTLIGAPVVVGTNMDCSDNRLTTLEGCPESVGYNFYCRNNLLTSLADGPKVIGGGVICSGNPERDWELERTLSDGE